MKRIAVLSLFLFLLLFLLLGCSRKQGEASLVRVQVERVELAEVAKTMSLTGEIRAQVESDLAFRVGGRIMERLVGVGDHVSSGQILAKLDPHEQQAAVDAAEADVRAADARFRDAA